MMRQRGLEVRDEPGRPLVIAPTKGKGRAAVAVLAAILAGGVAVVVIGGSPIERVVAACMVVAMLILLRVGGRRLWNREPLLVVTDNGLEHPKLGAIGWDDITALTITDGNQGRALKIYLNKRIDDRNASRSLPLRVLGRAGRLAGGPRITLPQILLPMRCDALRAAIELRAKREWPR